MPEQGRRWTLYVEGNSGSVRVIEPGPTYLGKGESVKVMPVAEHDAKLEQLTSQHAAQRRELTTVIADLSLQIEQLERALPCICAVRDVNCPRHRGAAHAIAGLGSGEAGEQTERNLASDQRPDPRAPGPHGSASTPDPLPPPSLPAVENPEED